ncbi:MAG TPA: hypothetical protein VH682_16385 [Gemmataceae bacterium]
MGYSVFRIEVDGFVQIGDGFLVLIFLQVGVAASAITRGIFGIGRDGLAEAGDGLVVFFFL